MKKQILALLLLLAPWLTQAQEREPLLLINPGRETIDNITSDALPGKTVTFFLPEESVPLKGRYPVVYVLGASPKDASRAAEFMELAPQKALLVGVDIAPEDLADAARLVHFFTRELVPYVDTNYSTLADARHRAVAARGTEGGLAAYALMYQRLLFSKALLADMDPSLLNAAALPRDLRLLALGDREALASLQSKLEASHFSYGRNFVLREGEAAPLLAEIPMDYWFSPEEKTSVKKLQAAVFPAKLPVTGGKARLSVTARLYNGRVYDFYPAVLRMSPPFLDWTAVSGTLSVISGAEPGKVKIRGGAEENGLSAKITLKKQYKPPFWSPT